jgi:hypothetical protein
MSTIVMGLLYPGEVKTCTLENYITERFIDPLQTSASQQFNNQAIQSQPNILADRIPGLVE